MHRWLRELALCFAAGAAGGAAKGLLVIACSYFPVSAVLGRHLANALHPQNLPHDNGIYARIVWGGLYAFLFLLPVASSSLLVSGLLWGAVITAVQWVVLPLLHGSLHFAAMPIVATLILNSAWGLVTALLLRWTR
jgi:hypothetical protein